MPSAVAPTLSVEPSPEVNKQVVDYKIVRISDLGLHRVQLRVRIFVQPDVEQFTDLMRRVRADAKRIHPYSAASIVVHLPGESLEGFSLVGYAEDAPGGEWGDAMYVKVGDYSGFRMKVLYYDKSGLERPSQEDREIVAAFWEESDRLQGEASDGEVADAVTKKFGVPRNKVLSVVLKGLFADEGKRIEYFFEE